MIAGLNGILESLGSDSAIINVNGISFQVYMPTSTLSTIGARGKEVKVYTHLQLREDIAVLYGFGSPDELSLFQLLMTVTGIGPKLGLAILSAMSPDQLSMAIATGSADLLTTIPGIGKKTANRIILELKDKVAGWVSAPAAQIARENTDVVAALTSLGYSTAEATRAVSTLPSSSDLSLEEKVKLALQYFGGK